MSKFGLACLGCLGVLVIVAVSVIGTAIGMYNSLISMNEKVTASWAAVETSYQRRFDLIPGLVEAVKGSMRQEQAVFGAIAEARTHYANAKTDGEKVGATQEYEGALARLMMVIENYPDLKSNQNVTGLMDELAGTENRISVARDRYNETVLPFNAKIKAFPYVFFAKMLGFEERAFFKGEEGSNKAVKVDLSL